MTTGHNGWKLPVSCVPRHVRKQMQCSIDMLTSSITGVMPQRVIREGEKAHDLLALIEDDGDIAVLVLAAATGSEGPGPLISTFTKNAGEFPIPIVIVPGNLSDADLDTMS
jgi:hypothetical protein